MPCHEQNDPPGREWRRFEAGLTAGLTALRRRLATPWRDGTPHARLGGASPLAGARNSAGRTHIEEAARV